MGTFLQDIRVGLRTFTRRPGFAFVATGTLALGIGAYATLFSVVDMLLLGPVDLPHAEQLVVVRARVAGELRDLTGPNLVDLMDDGDNAFAVAAGFWRTSATIENRDGTRESRVGVGATPGIFETLAVPMQLGRPWSAEAAGTGTLSALVISDRYWRSRLGADPNVIGSTLVLSGSTVVITGVMAPGFEFPTQEDADFIFPPVVDPASVQRAGLGAFTLLARLQPGLSLERARDEVERVWAGMRAEYPGDLRDDGIAVMGLRDYMVREVRPALLALLGATSLLLVLACANVANLMLSRGVRRDTEMSIRTSLGAGRGRLVRQLLVESALLAGAGGLVAIPLAAASLAVLRAVGPAEINGISEVGLSLSAIAVAFGLALACTLIVGLAPALRISRVDISNPLRGGARSTAGRRLRRFQGFLVVAQIAAAVVLAVGAGLLLRSFSRLSHVDPGYRTEGVLTAGVSAPADLYPDRASRLAFFDRIEREVAALPGVRHVGTTYRAPFSTGELSVPVRLADAPDTTPDQAPYAEIGIVSGGYIEALEIPLLRGRSFTDEDRSDSPRVALVSSSLARTLFGDRDPLGRRLSPVIGDWESSTDWAEVIGVVGDIRLQSLDADAAGTLYLASSQLTQPFGTITVQTEGDAAGLAGAVRDAILRIEPKVAGPTVETLASQRAESIARPRFNSLLLATFSLLALTLAAVGIYGLLSYSVATRQLELGVRMALGADRGSVLRLVLGEGMSLVAAGLVIGTGVALLASRAIAGLLYGIQPTDPTTYGGTVAAVAAIALAGCLLPALHAASGDALDALRGE